ncbi:NHL repeat-containing protein [Candidatus Saganbacteria bacterium]|nr:NHL repeat-containing protein [Candidatus Saganbacteria bacterium]
MHPVPQRLLLKKKWNCLLCSEPETEVSVPRKIRRNIVTANSFVGYSIVLLTILILFSGAAYAADQSSAVFEIGKKQLSQDKGFFEKVGLFLFGSKGVEDGFSTVTGVAVDQDDNIYLADSEKGRIVVLNEKRIAKPNDIGRNILKDPIGIAVDSSKKIYVTDSMLNELFIFDPEGNLVKSIAGSGTESGKFQRPSGILVDEKAGRIIVSDTGNHRLQIFDANGEFVSFLGHEGGGNSEFKYPTFLAKDPNGRTYVVDTINSRVQIFDQRLKFLSKFGDHGDALGFFGRPKGIAIDKGGRIYVADAIFNVVSVFDKDNKAMMLLGKESNLKTSLYSPMGIAVNSKGVVIVADSQNKRLVGFKINF